MAGWGYFDEPAKFAMFFEVTFYLKRNIISAEKF